MSAEWKDSDDPKGGDRPWEKAEEEEEEEDATELGPYQIRVPTFGLSRPVRLNPPKCRWCRKSVNLRATDGATLCEHCGEFMRANFAAFVRSLPTAA